MESRQIDSGIISGVASDTIANASFPSVWRDVDDDEFEEVDIGI